MSNQFFNGSTAYLFCIKSFLVSMFSLSYLSLTSGIAEANTDTEMSTPTYPATYSVTAPAHLSGQKLNGPRQSTVAMQNLFADNAVILQYHHVAEDTPAITSTRPDIFAEHLAYIAEHFTVLPLTKVIDALRQGTKVPTNTLVITFDDGYENIYRIAHPLLQSYGFPYTVFVNPPAIGQSKKQLTWEQITQMQNEGVTFANHTLDHLHLLDRLPNENEADWLARIVKNITTAEAQLTEKIGYSLKYLAYPFGEFSTVVKNRLKALNYTAFAQHSGGISSFSDFGALPRFPAGGRYASLKTLKTKMHSLAFPVIENSITDPVVTPTMPETMLLSVDNTDFYTSQVGCFFQGDRLEVVRGNIAGVANVTVKLPKEWPLGRSRINCTAPSKTQKGRFYWYSQPFFKARKDGTFID